MSPEEFEQYRNNAKRILGYMPIKTPCLTCQTPDSQIPKGSKLPNRRCLIRQCANKSELENCAYCARFPCDAVEASGGVWTREVIEKKLGTTISDKEYTIFVEPFEGIKRLETVRATLQSEQIIEPAKNGNSNRRIPDFPQNLPFSTEQTASFKGIYQMLSTILQSSFGRRDPDTFAQQHLIERHKAHILRFLWIFGRYGTFYNHSEPQLVIDAVSYGANRGTEKTLALWPFVRDTVFTILHDFGITCERVVLKGYEDDDLTTGTGYLRTKGWVMTMKFNQRMGDTAALKALQDYAQRLDTKYKKNAFRRFSKGDMTIFLAD